MTVEELQSKQEQLRAEMYLNAEKLGLSTANLKPIPDGVLDAEKYLTSSRKIMWVLKEPYDDIDEEGNPIPISERVRDSRFARFKTAI